MPDRYHVMGLQQGAWYIMYTAVSKQECEDHADMAEENGECELVMVVKVL